MTKKTDQEISFPGSIIVSDIKDIKINPENPRIIKDDNFKKLIESIKSFPEMLSLRPIVLDNNGMILGGNMRYKAAIEAGLKKIPVIYARDLTEEQKREFIIKDNSSFGDWDWEALIAAGFEIKELDDWSLDVPAYLKHDNSDLSELFNHPGHNIDGSSDDQNSDLIKLTFELTKEQHDYIVDYLSKINKSPEIALLEIVKYSS